MSGRVPQAIAIGASAGALEALSVILPALPRGFALPIFVVVHIPPHKRSALAELFQAKCTLRVREAEDKLQIAGGTVYFAPPDYHMQVEADRFLSLSTEPPILFSRPSIDVLFETAADAYGENLIGILLTGANDDGAAGLRAVYRAGGLAVVQTPETAFASAMPSAGLEACPDASVLNLQAITDLLIGVRT